MERWSMGIQSFSLQPSRCANFPNIRKSVSEGPLLLIRKQLCMHVPTPIYCPIDVFIFLETSFGTWLWQSSTRIVCCLPSMLELASKSLLVINRVSAIRFQWQVGLVGLQYVFGRRLLLVGIADKVFIRILTWMMLSHMCVFRVFCKLDQFQFCDRFMLSPPYSRWIPEEMIGRSSNRLVLIMMTWNTVWPWLKWQHDFLLGINHWRWPFAYLGCCRCRIALWKRDNLLIFWQKIMLD